MYTLRPATVDDFDFLYDLHEVTMRPYVEAAFGWDPADQQRRLRQALANYAHSVVLVDGADNGILGMETNHERVYLHTVEIHPRVQRRGVGAAIVRDVIARAEAQRLPARLRVFKSNVGARRLYQRLGFVVVGESETHYDMRCG